MANVVARRFLVFNKNLLKVRDFSCVSINNRCSSLFCEKLNDNHHEKSRFLVQGKFDYYKAPVYINFANNTRVQHFSNTSKDCDEDDDKKLTLIQKFKKMYKEYWYVLLPVHFVTSAAWFGGFYYMAKSGVDIVAILESLQISDRIINPLRDSHMGYLAVAYALYKVATPARYTVTLGGTTISINYLKKWGYIKPIPSKERLKEMYQEKKDDLLESFKETKEELKHTTEKIKDKKEDLIDDLDHSIKSIKRLGDRIKSKHHVVDEEVKKDKKSKEN